MQTIDEVIAKIAPPTANFHLACRGRFADELTVNLNAVLVTEHVRHLAEHGQSVEVFQNYLSVLVEKVITTGAHYYPDGFHIRNLVDTDEINLHYSVGVTYFESIGVYFGLVGFQSMDPFTEILSAPHAQIVYFTDPTFNPENAEFINRLIGDYGYRLNQVGIDVMYHELLTMFPRKS